MALGRSEEIRQRVELVLHGIGIWTPGDCGSTDACGRVILRGAPAGFKYSATGHPGLRHGRHRARHPADPHLGITLHPTQARSALPGRLSVPSSVSTAVLTSPAAQTISRSAVACGGSSPSRTKLGR